MQKFLVRLFVMPWIFFKLWVKLKIPFKSRIPNYSTFIGGWHNSGTTILREMLSAYPEIAALPRKGVELTSVFPNLESYGCQTMSHWNSVKAHLDPHNLINIANHSIKDWSLWWTLRKNKKIFLENSIIHGFMMPELELGFGKCRFIGVVHNGMCAAEGIYRRAYP